MYVQSIIGAQKKIKKVNATWNHRGLSQGNISLTLRISGII